jgi:hypothetical protein
MGVSSNNNCGSKKDEMDEEQESDQDSKEPIVKFFEPVASAEGPSATSTTSPSAKQSTSAQVPPVEAPVAALSAP